MPFKISKISVLCYRRYQNASLFGNLANRRPCLSYKLILYKMACVASPFAIDKGGAPVVMFYAKGSYSKRYL